MSWICAWGSAARSARWAHQHTAWVRSGRALLHVEGTVLWYNRRPASTPYPASAPHRARSYEARGYPRTGSGSIERRGPGRQHGMLVLVGANPERVRSPEATAPSPANTRAGRHTALRAFNSGRAAGRARLLDRFSQRLRVVEGEDDQLVSCDGGSGAVQVPGAHARLSQQTVRSLAYLWRAARSCTGARRRRAAIRRGRARSRAAPAEVGRRESGRGEGCSAARWVTWPSRSRISRGWRLTVCGNMTVSRSGFSARSAPRIAAAWVPVAPEV